MCTGRAGEAVLAFSASDSLPECFKGWIHITLRLYGGVLLKGGGGAEIAAPVSLFFKCFYSSVVQRQSCKLKVLGSVPSGGSCASNQQSYPFCIARLLPAELIPLQHLSVPTDMPKSLPALPYPMRKDSLAERSKAVAQGAIPRGRGLKLTAFIFFAVADVQSRNLDWQFHSSTISRSPPTFRPRRLPIVGLIIKAPLSLHSRGESG